MIAATRMGDGWIWQGLALTASLDIQCGGPAAPMRRLRVRRI